MSRSFGAMSLTMRSSIRTVPALMCSRPATMRSAVDFPEPDGPTRTVKPPSGMSSVSSSTALVPSGKTLLTPSNSILAMLSLSSERARAGGRDVIPVPERAALRHPLERLVVDVDDPEALSVALLPLEVVEQRPRVVAAYVDARGRGARQRVEMRAQVLEPLRVLDAAVDHRGVVVGRPVLGDEDRHVAVVAAQAQQQLVETFGVDLPAHRGRGRRPRGGLDAERRAARIRRDALGLVVVDAEEVDRRGDRAQVAAAHDVEGAEQPLVVGAQVVGIRPAEHRIKEPAVEMAV